MNKFSTAPILTAILVFALTFAGTLQAQKVGHIDFQTLLTSMPEAAAAQSELESYGAELQQTYDGYLKELETKQADYQANAGTWSQVVRESNENVINTLVQEIQKFEVSSQQALAEKQNALMAPLVEKAQNALKVVGDEMGLTYIVDSSTLLYIGSDMIDVTSQVQAKL